VAGLLGYDPARGTAFSTVRQNSRRDVRVDCHLPPDSATGEGVESRLIWVTILTHQTLWRLMGRALGIEIDTLIFVHTRLP
jgi:hypothetical protein